MLMAATAKKLVKRKLYEDEVTSAIFGPLKYIDSPSFTWDFLKNVIQESGYLWPADGRPDSHEISFWPELKSYDGKVVEPDLLFQFADNGTPILNVLVEIKWDSPLSYPDQLIRQWFHKEKRGGKWLHIYLTKHATTSQIELSKSFELVPNQFKKETPEWENSLLSVTWGHVQKVAAKKLNTNIWGNGVAAFLRKQGISTFTGFGWLKSHRIDFEHENAEFYAPTPWFAFDLKSSLDTTDLNFYNHS